MIYARITTRQHSLVLVFNALFRCNDVERSYRNHQSSDPNWHISQFAHYSNIQYLSLLVVSIAAFYIIATEECIEDKDETVLSSGDPCIYH